MMHQREKKDFIRRKKGPVPFYKEEETSVVIARSGVTWQSCMVNDAIIVRHKNSWSEEKDFVEMDFSLSLRAERNNPV